MVDIDLIRLLFERMQNRVRYLLGAKAPDLDMNSHAITQIDCSGFTRYVLHRAGLEVPDGSQNQLAWARANLPASSIAAVEMAAGDTSRLFIGFLSPKPGSAWPRHVWLAWRGRTMESRSGAGVSSRPASHYGKSCKEWFEIR